VGSAIVSQYLVAGHCLPGAAASWSKITENDMLIALKIAMAGARDLIAGGPNSETAADHPA
jgi:hypothetical protein